MVISCSRVRSSVLRIIAATIVLLIFISILLSLLGKDLLNDRGNSFICKKVLEKLFLFLRFKLAYINAVNVRYLYLIRLYLDALDVF